MLHCQASVCVVEILNWLSICVAFDYFLMILLVWRPCWSRIRLAHIGFPGWTRPESSCLIGVYFASVCDGGKNLLGTLIVEFLFGAGFIFLYWPWCFSAHG
jgi:hypothetical protein